MQAEYYSNLCCHLSVQLCVLTQLHTPRRLWDMITPDASCTVGKPHVRANVSDGFSVEEKGLRCLSWSDLEAPNGAAGGTAGTATAPTQCHQDSITSLEVSQANSWRSPFSPVVLVFLTPPDLPRDLVTDATGDYSAGCAATGAEWRARWRH